MDKRELEIKLERFKEACIIEGCIDSNDTNSLELEEAYPGAIPASFIINVHVKKTWLDAKYSVAALKELIKLLYEKVDSDTFNNILTLRICTDYERQFYDNLPSKESL